MQTCERKAVSGKKAEKKKLFHQKRGRREGEGLSAIAMVKELCTREEETYEIKEEGEFDAQPDGLLQVEPPGQEDLHQQQHDLDPTCLRPRLVVNGEMDRLKKRTEEEDRAEALKKAKYEREGKKRGVGMGAGGSPRDLPAYQKIVFEAGICVNSSGKIYIIVSEEQKQARDSPISHRISANRTSQRTV